MSNDEIKNSNEIRHIPELSCYNSNVYKLSKPLSCRANALYEEAQDDVNEIIYRLAIIGLCQIKFLDKWFVLYFNDEKQITDFTIDELNKIKLEDKYIWT